LIIYGTIIYDTIILSLIFFLDIFLNTGIKPSENPPLTRSEICLNRME